MNVRRITRQKDAPHTIAIHHPYICPPKGDPVPIVKVKPHFPGALVDNLLKAFERRLFRLIRSDLSLKLKELRARQRTQCKHSQRLMLPDMPVIPIEIVHFHIADKHPLRGPCIAFESYPESVPHEAVAAVRADEISHVHALRDALVRKSGRYTVLALLELSQFDTEFHAVPQLFQPRPQDFFHAPLRDDQRARIGNIRRRISPFVNIAITQDLSPVIRPKGQVKTSVSQNLIDDSEIVQHLQPARLQTFSPRSREVRWRLIDDPERHAAPRKIASQSKACRTSAHDEYRKLLRHIRHSGIAEELCPGPYSSGFSST